MMRGTDTEDTGKTLHTWQCSCILVQHHICVVILKRGREAGRHQSVSPKSTLASNSGGVYDVRLCLIIPTDVAASL